MLLFRPFSGAAPSGTPPNPSTPTSESETEPKLKQPKPLTAMLPHFDTKENTPTPPPPGSRVDSALAQRQGKSLWEWSIKDLWKFGWFVGGKASHLTSEIYTHTLGTGPRKPSWGLEMTLITSFMRDVGKASDLANIDLIRSLLSLSSLLPLPPSAIVTPLSFPIRRRNLRGILSDFDAHEFDPDKEGAPDQKVKRPRELSAEWIVERNVWRRREKEWKKQKERERLKAMGLEPEEDKDQKGKSKSPPSDRIVLYLHGGAYYVFSAASHRLITIEVSKACDARVLAINYRLAPETRFPGPLHDAVSGYLRLIEDLEIPPENILVAGDSAGGGLSLALLMYLRDNNYPLPSGAILMSPWVDLTMSCDSWDSNAAFDIVPRPEPGDHLNPVFCYLGEEGVKRYLTHPYASPLFGNFQGLPPLLIQYGEAEVLRDEITLLCHKASLGGVTVLPEMFEDQIHVFQTFPFLEATEIAFRQQRNFVRHVVSQHVTPQSLSKAETALASELESAATKIVRSDGEEVSMEDADKEMKDSPSDKETDDSVEEDVKRENASEVLETPSASLGETWVDKAPASQDLLPPIEDASLNDSQPLDHTTPRVKTSSLPENSTEAPSATIVASPEKAIYSRPGRIDMPPSTPPRMHRTSSSSMVSPRRGIRPSVLSMTSPSSTSFHSIGSSSPTASTSTSSSQQYPFPSGPASPHTSSPQRIPLRRQPSNITVVSDRAPQKPATRKRSQSHPDIVELVQSYSSIGPVVRTRHYSSKPAADEMYPTSCDTSSDDSHREEHVVNA